MENSPTEYDMLIDDETVLLEEIQEHKMDLIKLEQELQVIRDKISFIRRAVPDDVIYSIHQLT